MLYSLFSKDYRFFSLNNIVKYVHNKPLKDLTLNFYLTVEVFLIQSGMISPGELFEKSKKMGGDKLNLFFIKNMDEYKEVKEISKGNLKFEDNLILTTDGTPLIKLVPYSFMCEFKVDEEVYSTVIIDEKAEVLDKNQEVSNCINKISDKVSILSVDGIKIINKKE